MISGRRTRGRTAWRLDAGCYRALLYLYPSQFRRAFSAEMLRDFSEARADALRSHGPRAAWAFRLHILGDLVRSVPLQWWRSGWPVILALAALATFAPTAILATAFQRLQVPAPASVQDDLLLLELLVVALLALIVATILVTVCFAGPRRVRARRL
jgi:hypothetical protein